MRSDFYVYVLLDPRKPGDYEYGPLKFKHEPFYVGKGKGRRDISHFRPGNLRIDSKRFKNTKKANKIRKIMEAGFMPLPVRIKSNVTEVNSFRFEVKAIELIGRGKNGPLVNCTDGGEGLSGYVCSAVEKAARAKVFRDYLEGLTPTDRKAHFERIQASIRKTVESMPESKKLEWAANISKAAANRTPEEREALREKYREIQLNLPESVQKAKNRKVSKGNKLFQATITPKKKEEIAESLRGGQLRYWSNADEKERTRRAKAIADGYAKKSKRSLAQKNAKIAEKIAAQHASASVYDSRMRSYMVMCGVMLKNLGKGDDEVLKAKLRRRGERFYSKPENLEHKPAVLREKVRKLMAA